MGEDLISFEKKDKIVKLSSELGYNDVKFAFSYGVKNIYFMLHLQYIHIQEYKTLTEKNEYPYLYKKDVELKGDVDNERITENGNDFIICKKY